MIQPQILFNQDTGRTYHVLSSCALYIGIGLAQCGTRLARSLPTQQAEKDVALFAAAMFLRGGLKVSYDA